VLWERHHGKRGDGRKDSESDENDAQRRVISTAYTEFSGSAAASKHTPAIYKYPTDQPELAQKERNWIFD
jgi:hypothetical protein